MQYKDTNPTVEMTIPFLIRLLEYTREEVKTDSNLHIMLEKLLRMAQDDTTLQMTDFADIEASNPK